MGAAETLSPGATIAGYRIDGVLGEGGMGVVYEATQLSLERKVALKVLASRLGDDDDFRRRFRREGRLQAAIDHPNIVTVIEAGESDAGLFLAMRLVRGETLKQLISAGSVDVRRTVTILRAIAEALDTAHEGGLIHRDVKPHNILVDARDEAYLGDFGLTKAPDDPNLTRSGEFLGTPNYISPEQVRGEPATAASDIYALGAVLFESLTGIVPFPKPSHAAVLYAHVAAPPPAVTAFRPDLPAAVDAAVARAMAKDPADRQATASALIDEAEWALGMATEPVGLPAETGSGRYLHVPVRASRANGTARPDDSTIVDGPVTAVTSALRGASATLPEPLPALPATAPGAGTRAPRKPLAVLAGLAVVGAAAAGVLLAPGERPEASAARALATNGLRVSIPASWRPAPPVAAIDRRGLSGVVAAAPGLPEGAGLLAGRAGVSGSALLPAGLRSSVVAVPAPDRVRLAGGDAYRYRGMRLRESSLAVTAYVLPTTRGAGVVACHAPADGGSFAEACERAAGTLRIAAGRPLDLGPSQRYASRLSRVVRTLADRRDAGRRRLRAARSPANQARRAGQLATAFRDAARAVAQLDAPAGGGPAHSELERGLERAAGAYGNLRRAAAARDRSAFRRARKAVRRSEGGVRDALSGLRRLGYRAI